MPNAKIDTLTANEMRERVNQMQQLRTKHAAAEHKAEMQVRTQSICAYVCVCHRDAQRSLDASSVEGKNKLAG